MTFNCRRTFLSGVSVAAITLAASQSMAQENVPAADPAQTPPAAQQLPEVVTTTPKQTAKPVKKKKVVVRKAPRPAVATAPQPTPAEIAAREQAEAERVWTTTGNPTPTKVLGNNPPPYAGGQVATGGGLGILGNRSIMDTPFNQTSYTAKTIQDQQARSVADVLLNDPSVRSTQSASAGYGQDTFNIRGFFYSNSDLSLNGLYGLAPNYTTIPNFVERVEVLKGPSALLNGVPAGGAVGGSVNLVTKKAPDIPITQVTTSYQSDGYFGTALDFGRRYGTNNEFGVRFNGSYGGGDTAIDGQDTELGNAVLNLDYRGERLRLSADVGYQAEDLNSVQRFITFNQAFGLASVPPAPRAGSNYGVPWSFWKPKDTFAMFQGEYDVTDHVTVYGAYGWHDSGIDFRYPSPTVINEDGDWLSRPIAGSQDIETWSGLAGVRTEFNTGPVNHLFNVNYSSVDRDDNGKFAGAIGPSCFPPLGAGLICSNLYNPTDVPVPTFGPRGSTLASTNLSSVGVSDTMSVFDDRIQFTIGARRQTAGTESRDLQAGTVTSSTEDSVWSPAYALLVKPFNNVSLYANYIEGLQMGTTVPATFVNAGEIIPPFQTKQKEVGVKFDFGKISTTVAAFEITRPSLITVGTPPNLSQQLDGEQRNRGVELNVFGELTPAVRLLGGVTFLDGVLTKTAGGLNDGNKAQGVADVNVNVGAEWDTPFIPGLTLTGRAIYTSDVYINAANTLEIPDWVRFDVGARYTFDSPWNGKPITVRLAVENVANENYYAGSYTSDGIVTVGAPRTYLLSSTINF